MAELEKWPDSGQKYVLRHQLYEVTEIMWKYGRNFTADKDALELG